MRHKAREMVAILGLGYYQLLLNGFEAVSFGHSKSIPDMLSTRSL
jgi:hypothetical protein